MVTRTASYRSKKNTWSLPGAMLDVQFSSPYRGQLLGDPIVPTSMFTITRATVGNAQRGDGIWVPFASGDFRITDKGWLIELAVTNNALWSRDFTNAAWVKSNMTVALDQTGIDGGANTASSILATGANATVLQAITLGSASRIVSFWVKRITGSGTVNITQDNGSTWTVVTVTTDWTEVSFLQTVTNPTIGIRLVTSGDKIAVDNAQMSSTTVLTSPIYTTTATVTRNADVVTLNAGPAANLGLISSGSFFFQTNACVVGTGNLARWATGNAFMLYVSTSTVRTSNGANSTLATIGGSGLTTGIVKSAHSWDGTSMTTVSNGGTISTNANALTTNTGVLTIGSNNGASAFLNGYLQRLAISPLKGQFDSMTL